MEFDKVRCLSVRLLAAPPPFRLPIPRELAFGRHVFDVASQEHTDDQRGRGREIR